MFAIVANGYQGICKTQRQLDAIIAIYPYPKFRKFHTTEEARQWIRMNQRSIQNTDIVNYGDTSSAGYATVKYQIRKDEVLYEVDTRLLGFVKIQQTDKVLVEARPRSLVVRYLGLALNDDLIMHHIIAIRNIMRFMGGFVDLDICVPDISIYLALTKYRGKNYMLKSAQHDMAKRLGAVAITVEGR